jgi:hypothetical protein
MREIEYSIVARDRETGTLIYEAALDHPEDIPNFISEVEPEVAQYVEHLSEDEELYKFVPEYSEAD